MKAISAKLLVFFLAFFITRSGKSQPTIANLSYEVQIDNVLRYDIVFETDVPAKAYANFGQSSLDRHSDISEKGNSHKITLFGLLPETEYSFEVIAFDSLGANGSGLYSFTTGLLPPDILLPTTLNANEMEGGYYSVQLESAESPQTNILNREGQVVWYERTEVPGSPCTGFFWTEQNTLLHMQEDCHTLREVSLAGAVLREVVFPDSFYLHHEFFPTQDDHILAVVAVGRTIDKTPVGGPSDALVVGDGIVELDWAGNLIHYWTVFDHFDPLTSTDNSSFWNSYFGIGSEDWLHGNSLSIDSDGHYLLGINKVNQVIKIHRTSGAILWTFGLGGDFSFELAEDIFLQQHSFFPTGEEKYLLFDNLGISGLSRTLELELDLTSNSATRVATYGTQVDVFTPVVGNALRLPNGNTSTIFGQKGRMIEETVDQEIVWDLEYNAFTYRGYFLPALDPILPDLLVLDSAVCVESGAMLPSAFYPATNLPGGYFSGAGIVDGLFDPNLVSFGSHLVSYHYGPLEETALMYVDTFPLPPIISQQGDLLQATGGERWQWYLDGAAIAGATQSTYLAVEPGTYTVASLSEGGCARWSEPLSLAVLSTSDQPEATFLEVHPNPSQGLLHLSCQVEGLGRIDLYDYQGQRLRSFDGVGRRSLVLELGDLPAGWYLLEVQGKQGVYRRPFIRQ